MYTLINSVSKDCLTNGLEFDDAADLCKVGTTVTDICKIFYLSSSKI